MSAGKSKPGSGKSDAKKSGKNKGEENKGRRQLDTEVRSIQPLNRGGAPLSPTTRWLENEMRKLHDLADYPVLYDVWIRKYWRSKGQYPKDPKRAFDQAARGCLNRILRERGLRG